VAGLSRETGYEVIPMQGSGTMGLEAVLASVTPPDGRIAVLVNGAYGRRLVKMARMLTGMEPVELSVPEDQPTDPDALEALLKREPGVRIVACCHCETTSGILNPIEEVGRVARRHGALFLVDSMSAFGGVEFDLQACGIDYLVSSSNKCIEGVPGFSFVIARRAKLEETEGWARSLSLDLLDQLRVLETTGQFRFTPPVQVMLAFRQALAELEQEGGVPARAARYARNHRVLVDGMRALGFATFLPDRLQSHVITTFHTPEVRGFDLDELYDRLEDAGFVIYGGKVLHHSTFRIGTIGRLVETDCHALLGAMARTLDAMGVSLS
jgi:2-aminoethylphosphonate-pyruvate transaminase